MSDSTALSVTTADAIARLERSMAVTSLDGLATSRRRSMLLVDISGSMADTLYNERGLPSGRKIDALRTTVVTLRETHAVPMASFGGREIELIEGRIPEPQGTTPLAQAIDFGAAQGASHLVIVTDGQPDNEDHAMRSARAFGGVIDIFYIGPGNDQGAVFSARLAAATGGKVNLTDLGRDGATLALSAGIAGLLGDGSGSGPIALGDGK